MPDEHGDSASDDRKNDPSRERGTPTEPGGSPFPDPHAPKPTPEVEIIPGQPIPSPNRRDDGGVRAARPTAQSA